jgi:hypothetical protein
MARTFVEFLNQRIVVALVVVNVAQRGGHERVMVVYAK